MKVDVVGEITEIEPIAAGPSLRVRALLRKAYGVGRWRKLKGVATVRLPNGRVRRVELHWYEAHGIGKRDFKIKDYLDQP
jgi:hypothetical protein